MKSFLFLLLAGYAVRCDDNNYYVIEMPDDTPLRVKKPFKVYWNVPTMQCSSKKIYFDNLFENFGIIQNNNDRFKGEQVTILYDPGLFPALFKNETSGKFRFRNGGVPQEGNLTLHLEAFKEDLDSSIPATNFSGVGIIDFESWRPIFRQNFGQLVPYKNVSIQIEKKLHWWWRKTWIEAEAKRRFEEAARTFMQTTLSVAKQLRPQALWGFYGFPYCFNMASNNMVEQCASNVPEENDQIDWLWSESTALYPSVYSSVDLSTSQMESLIRGRVREASRCANSNTTTGTDQILPYFWFRYRDAGYLSVTDLTMALATLYQSNATGVIIWGSSNDVNTVTKCDNLLDYVETILGPAIAKYTIQVSNDESDVTSTTSSNTDETTEYTVVNESTKQYLDSENDSEENQTIDKLINRTSNQNMTTNSENTVLQNNSVPVDMQLNPVLNNVSITTTDTLKTKDDKKNQSDNVDLISTTEINVKVDSTETSQILSSVVTNNPLLSEINNTSPQVDSLDTSTEISKSSEINLIELGSTESVTTASQEKIYETTDNYNDTKLDDEDDNFINVVTYIKTYSTLNIDQTTDAIDTSYETNLSKNNKKELNGSSTKQFNEEIETSTNDNVDVNNVKGSENINESSTHVATETEAVTPSKSLIGEENVTVTVETSTHNDVTVTISTKGYQTDLVSSTLPTTRDFENKTDLINLQESTTKSTNLTDVSNNPDNSTEKLRDLEENVDATSEGPKATDIAEETTMVPTSTEQVVN